MWKMLHLAINDHYQKTQGLLPRRFEMHPANYAELRMDERMLHMPIAETNDFMGVPIVVDVQATRLKMITHDNKVEYL
jgi:hypothetical protein